MLYSFFSSWYQYRGQDEDECDYQHEHWTLFMFMVWYSGRCGGLPTHYKYNTLWLLANKRIIPEARTLRVARLDFTETNFHPSNDFLIVLCSLFFWKALWPWWCGWGCSNALVLYSDSAEKESSYERWLENAWFMVIKDGWYSWFSGICGLMWRHARYRLRLCLLLSTFCCRFHSCRPCVEIWIMLTKGKGITCRQAAAIRMLSSLTMMTLTS